MSVYDRDYMNAQRGFSTGAGRARISAVAILIIINVAAFFFEAFGERLWGREFFDVFALSRGALSHGRVWTLVTYAFLHGSLLHIFCNMLGLFFVGGFMERAIGVRKFLALYFFGVLAGALAWLAFSFASPSSEVVIGASAAVVAVFAAFCLTYPPVPLTFLLFFVFPVSIKPLTMLKIMASFEVAGLLYWLSGGDSYVAYSAHLGGIAAGVAYIRLLSRGSLNFIDRPWSSPFKKRPKTPARAENYRFKVDILNPAEMSREVDRILDKISAQGFSSLSDGERETLRRAKESLK